MVHAAMKVLVTITAIFAMFVGTCTAQDSATNGLQRAAGRHELVPDPVVYASAKAAANRAAGHGPRALPTGAVGLLPKIVTSFEGTFDPAHANPDETSAIGPDRLIEFINTRFGIFDRQGNLLADSSAEELTGATTGDFITDPQILWDPSSRRFYYTIYENRNHAGVLDPGISWGSASRRLPGRPQISVTTSFASTMAGRFLTEPSPIFRSSARPGISYSSVPTASHSGAAS